MRTMTNLTETLVRNKGIVYECGEDGCWGSLWKDGVELQFIASWGGGWEHVSVKACIEPGLAWELRIPTWDEMCFVKETFWADDECAFQLHPPKVDYVNTHPCVLHLWRPVGGGILMPPKNFV